jgi:hypothetical protein
MKTEISVPNPLFDAAERLSQKLGMSLSESCVAALTAYIAAHQSGDITFPTGSNVSMNTGKMPTLTHPRSRTTLNV